MGNLFWTMELEKYILMQCNSSGLSQSENAELNADLWRNIEVHVFS